MKNVLLLQGANMEYLGYRNPELYGTTTADELDALLKAEAPDYRLDLDIRYTNIEGEAIGWIYEAQRRGYSGLIMNPAGFLYSGYALRDCVKAVALPYVEVHMTNLDAHGKHSVVAETADAMISGMGIESYRLALHAMELLTEQQSGSGA